MALVWSAPLSPLPIPYNLLIQSIACAIGCLGFAILFNIYGPGGLICVLGGTLTWVIYALCLKLGTGEIVAYFWGAVFASAYSEVSARIRKCPAIAYLVISIFPLIPGSGVYYTMESAVKGHMEQFASKGMFTAAIAGTMALGILLVSTAVRLWSMKRQYKK